MLIVVSVANNGATTLMMLSLIPPLMLPGEQLDKLLHAASSSSSSSDSSSSPTQQQLLGWFSYRPGTPCTPSMREAAVCKKLQEWTANNSSSSRSQQPVVFGLITSQPDHNTATISLQYKFYRVKDASSSTDSSTAAAAWAGSSGGFGSSSGFNRHARHDPEHPLLQPLHLSVHNLGAGQAAAAAAAGHAGPASASSSSNKWGSASLPALAAVLQQPNASVLSEQQVQQLQAAAAAQAGAALQAVQGLYDSLLDELQVAAAEVRLHWFCIGSAFKRPAALTVITLHMSWWIGYSSAMHIRHDRHCSHSCRPACTLELQHKHLCQFAIAFY
jgi:hypothetical protein